MNAVIDIKSTYEEWEKIYDLHEAYDKCVPITAKGWGWTQCSVCGRPLQLGNHYRKATTRDMLHHINGSSRELSVNDTAFKFLLRKLTPQLSKEMMHHWQPTQVFESISLDTMNYLVDNCEAPWAALAIILRRRNNIPAKLRAMVLTNPMATYEMCKQLNLPPNDTERNIVAGYPKAAEGYATHIDKCYHPVTRMSALKDPSIGISYVREWGKEMTLTEKERKRLSRTMYGAFYCAKQDGVDRPEYRKRLVKSAYYGATYVYDVVGDRDKEFEKNPTLRRGSDCLKYLAAFGMELEDMDGDPMGPRSQRDSADAYDGYVKCRAIIAHAGKIEPEDIATVPYRHRSKMAIGYLLATKSCTPEIVTMLRRRGAFNWIARNFATLVTQINVTRKRRNLVPLAENFVGLHN